jgi:hypothetical protein
MKPRKYIAAIDENRSYFEKNVWSANIRALFPNLHDNEWKTA